VSDEHIISAWELFQKYDDQKFSFTDCISFAVMNLLKINTVFAYDSHFSVMGFCLIGEAEAFERIIADERTSSEKTGKRKH
jgi:predicted nucleic acid-binding protein